MEPDTACARVELGDVATIKARLGWKGLMANEYLASGCYFLSTPNIKGHRIDFENAQFIPQWRFDESPEIQLRVGDVLLVKDGSTLGIANIVRVLPGPTTVNGSIAVIRPSEALAPEYLFQYIQGAEFQKLIQLKKAGLGVPHLFQADLRKFELRLPSAPEQRRIAEILGTLDEAIRKTEQIAVKLQQVHQGLLHDLLTYGIDENGELRDPNRHPDQFKDSDIGTIPREWQAAPFREYGASERPYLKTGPFGSSLKQEHWVEHGVPVITIGALGEGEFIHSELLHVSDATAKDLAAYRVRQGDIVFSRVADVGRSVVVNDREDGWLMSSNLMWIALDQRRTAPAFVQANIAANPVVRSQIRRFVNAGGREVANAGVLNSLLLPWPNVLEQKRITALLAASTERLAVEERQLAKLRLLKQGLADDLLSGRARDTGERLISRRTESPRGQLALEL